MKRERQHIADFGYFYNPYYYNNTTNYPHNVYPQIQYYDPYYMFGRSTYDTFNYPYSYLYSYPNGNNINNYMIPYTLPVESVSKRHTTDEPRWNIKNTPEKYINQKNIKDISYEKFTKDISENIMYDKETTKRLSEISYVKNTPLKDIEKPSGKNLKIKIECDKDLSYSDVPSHIISDISRSSKIISNPSTKPYRKHRRLFYTILHERLRERKSSCFIGNFFFITPKEYNFCKNIRRHNIESVSFELKNEEFIICWTTVIDMDDVPLFSSNDKPVELPGILSKPKIINGKHILAVRKNQPCKIMSSEFLNKYIKCAKKIAILITNTYEKNYDLHSVIDISTLASSVEKSFEYKQIVMELPGHLEYDPSVNHK